MERVRRLSDFWNWLPAFRAVAESEHLPTASRELFVSVPALSRTVRLLEDALGHKLFDRVGRSLVLNERGRNFLQAVRAAMRMVDEGVDTTVGQQHFGTVTISVPGPFAPLFVLPALRTLRDTHPGIVARLVSHSAVNSLLSRGHVDLAVLDDPVPSDELTLERLGAMAHSVWCRPGHPLDDASPATLADLSDAAFVAPITTPDGATPDNWPAELPRRVVLRVTQMQVAVDAALADDLLIVLPDVVARSRGLVRVPIDGVAASEVYLVQRPPLPGVAGRITVVADAIRATADALPWG